MGDSVTSKEFEKAVIVGVLPLITRSGRGEVRQGRVKSTPSPSIPSRPSWGLLWTILRRLLGRG
jgi:hypothetical protein